MNRSTVLDSVAFGYQPLWNRARQLAAVRLSVHTLQPEAVDAAHLLQTLGDDWPVTAPVLVIAFDTPHMAEQALDCEPVPNTWLEVPGGPFTSPEGLAQLAIAAHRGHQLLRHTELAAVRSEIIAPIDVRSLLDISAKDALQALQSRPTQASPVVLQRSPILGGQIYSGVGASALADHCLDEAGAWGLLGWPDDDVLHAWRHMPMACDAAVIAQVHDAIESDASLDRLERFVRQDPVLVYRLLLLVNSAAYGLRHEIDSVRHALMMIGFTALKTWLADQMVGSETDPNLHPVRYGMVMRARMAQHLLDESSDDTLRSEVFLTALFSQLDRLLHKPLTELLGKLPLPGRVYDALLRETGPYNAYLDVSRAQGETGQLHQLPGICEHHGVSLEHANRALIHMLATSRDQYRKR